MGNQFYSPLDKVTLSRRIQNKKAFPFILMALNWRQKAKVQHVSVLKMRSFLFISNHPASFTREHNNDVSALKKYIRVLRVGEVLCAHHHIQMQLCRAATEIIKEKLNVLFFVASKSSIIRIPDQS